MGLVKIAGARKYADENEILALDSYGAFNRVHIFICFKECVIFHSLLVRQ